MKDKYVVGLGEALWDVLPDGRKLGGAPANFAYHAGQFGLNAIAVSALCEEVLYLADEPFQQQTSQRSEDTHQKTDDEDELVGGKVCPSPFEHNGQ